MYVQKPDNCGNSPKARLVMDVGICYLFNACGLKNDSVEDSIASICAEYFDRNQTGILQTVYKKARIILSMCHGKIGCIEYELTDEGNMIHPGCLIIEFETAAAKKIVRISEYDR